MLHSLCKMNSAWAAELFRAAKSISSDSLENFRDSKVSKPQGTPSMRVRRTSSEGASKL